MFQDQAHSCEDMEPHVPELVAMAKGLLERAAKGAQREFASAMIDAARDVVGFRLQLAKLQEYGKEVGEMVSRDTKSAMFFQLAKFREDYGKHSKIIVEMNQQLNVTDWGKLEEANVRCLQNTVVVDYASHKATMLCQEADRLMEDAKEKCGVYHLPETSWKASLPDDADLKQVLKASHETIGKIKSADINSYIKSLKEAQRCASGM